MKAQKKDYSVLLVLALVLTAVLVMNGARTGNVVASRHGSILVDSYPSGADIIVDGVDRGFTTQTVDVSVGTHDVVVRSSGYLDYSNSVYVSPGEIVRVNANLEQDPNYRDTSQYGTLTVTSNPSGASVFVDDVYQGLTPIRVNNVRPGSHLLRLSKTGLKDYQTTIYTYAQQNNNANANL